MYSSCIGRSSSNQKINSAPPSLAINEEREKCPQRTVQSGNVLPKYIKCLEHKDTGQRKDTRQRYQEVRSSRIPCPGWNMVPAGPLLSATPLTLSIQLRLTSATHIDPFHWHARLRELRGWLQHSIIAPAVLALTLRCPRSWEPGGSPGGRSSSST